MGFAQDTVRRPLPGSVEIDRQLDPLGRPRLDAHRIEIFSRMERRVDLCHPAADTLEQLAQIIFLLPLIRVEHRLGEGQRPLGTSVLFSACCQARIC